MVGGGRCGEEGEREHVIKVPRLCKVYITKEDGRVPREQGEEKGEQYNGDNRVEEDAGIHQEGQGFEAQKGEVEVVGEGEGEHGVREGGG